MRRQRQHGVALIKAMLVVALATSVAVAMVSRQQFDIRRTANLLQAGQATLYADGVVAWAQQLLRRDRKDNRIDHNEEDWATILPPIPIEGGSISGYIADLQGRFNLNSLLKEGKPDAEAIAAFRRLLAALQGEYPEVAARLSPELVNVIIDWIDPDLDATFPGGAEDDYYMGLERAYRCANAPLVTPSELLLLKGVDAEVYAVLRQHVATLDADGKLNINTASPAVLMSLANGLSRSDAEALEQERPYSNVNDFLAQNALAGRVGSDLKDMLTVESEHFLIVSQVEFGALLQQHHSVMRRDENGNGRILMRAQGTY